MKLKNFITKFKLLNLSKFLLFLSLILLNPLKAQSEAAANRFALVIGNAAYESAGKLVNPVNDADAMERSLKNLGFDVIALKNAGQREMERTISKFGKKLRKGGDLPP